MNELLFKVSAMAPSAIVAITLHEAAHGFAANRLGDDTALRMGRVTLNPLAHIDPFGTILLPALLLFVSNGQAMFGYAKPVPVNFGRLRSPRRDMALVAAAGPAMNGLLAVAAALSLPLAAHAPEAAARWASAALVYGVLFNLVIALFNLLPLPPLDGGRIVLSALPARLARPFARIERYGFLILLGTLFLLPLAGERLGVDLDLFDWLVLEPAERATVWLIEAARG